MKKPIYLDNHATTPVDPDALAAMLPYYSEKFGNAMSGNHSFGWTANSAIEKARTQIATLIGAESREIVFTAGATESAHLAILGSLEEHGQPAHIITAATEHKCILEIARRAEKFGHSVTLLPVNSYGHIDLTQLKAAIRPTTRLISLMHGNNEIGTIHPIAEVGAIAQKRGLLFHVDAAQTTGRSPIHVRNMNIDLMSMSAHKIYGPKGVGALFVRQTNPRVHLAPYIVGGGQEKGLRGGTHNVPGIVGFGAACEIASKKMADEIKRLTLLRDKTIQHLTAQLPDVVLNGHPTERLCNNINFTIYGVSSERILTALHDVAFSSGSACSFGATDVSHVLKALGHTGDRTAATLRFGLGRFTEPGEVDEVCERLIACVQRARAETTSL